MAQKFLDGSDVVAAFEQMRGERMPEGVASRPLRQTCLRDGLPNGLLNERLVNMMPSLFTGLGVRPSVLLWEDPLPTPFGVGVAVLSVESHRQLHAAPALRKVALVDWADVDQVLFQGPLQGLRQHGPPAFAALAVTDRDLAAPPTCEACQAASSIWSMPPQFHRRAFRAPIPTTVFRST